MDEQDRIASASRATLDVDAGALSVWMAANVPGYAGPLTLDRFNGGQSNPTYKISASSGDYVLRRKPAGVLLASAHAVDREYRVLVALYAAGFPAPRPFGLCMDEGLIGSAFYVMSCVEGRIFWDPSFSEAPSAERPLLLDALNKTLADLHRINPIDVGLADYGRSGNYLGRQVSRWSRQYTEDADAGRLPAMDRLVDWLQGNLPDEPGTTARLIHGDYRSDNVIFHPTEPRVVAVLDWELSTLGDPIADFVNHLMMYRLPPTMFSGLAGRDLATLNLPDEQTYLDAYLARVGADRTSVDLRFMMTFSMFRLAAILHGIKGRLVRGNAASSHARTMAEMLPHLADLALTQIENPAVTER